MSDIEQKVTEIHTWVKDLRETVKAHDHFISGNGTPGAKVRLDRLEQSDQRKQRWFKLGSIPLIGVIIEAVTRHWQ